MGLGNLLKDKGIGIRSEEAIKKELGIEDEKKDSVTRPIVQIKKGTEEMAVHKGVIPMVYKDVEFDSDIVKANLTDAVNKSSVKFKIKNFEEYISLLNSIISSIRIGTRPKHSYLIGAPNGCGKTSFAMTCLKIMVQRDLLAVPYVSLLELSEIKLEHERKLIKGIELRYKVEEELYTTYSTVDECDKMPQTITGRFSWSEYMHTPILFCFMTGLNNKVIESHILKTILEIRGAKGLPTIVFMSTSIKPYKSDKALREYIWDEILDYSDEKECYDRVYHVSCYKQSNLFVN